MNADRIRRIEALPYGRFLRSTIMMVGVLAFSLLLLIPWFTSIAAPASESISIASNLESQESLLNDYPSDLFSRLNGKYGDLEISASRVITDYDYAVTKYPNPPIFTIGTNNEYIINVSGEIARVGSPSPAIYDRLPTGMKWTNITASNWSCGSVTTEINCSYALTVPVGSVNFPPIRARIDVPIDIEPIVKNVVSINPPDPHTGNDVYTATTIIDSVDLAIEKTVYPQAVALGDYITYTIVITNYGPATATNVSVVDILSTEGISITSYTAYPGWLTKESTTKFTWHVGTLPKGTSSRSTLVVSAITLPASNGKQAVNTATVSSSNASDWRQPNNTATASFIVGGLTISKSVTPASVYTGEPITFTINFQNTSATANANSVRIQDVFTNGLDILATDPPGCKPSTNTVNCSYGTLTPLQSKSLVVRTRAKTTLTGVETITNTATVFWTPQGSSTILNRTSEQANIEVTPGGTLAVGKDDARTYVYRGETISYTVNITNVGSLAVDSLRVTDTMSNNLIFVSINPGSLSMIEESANNNTRVWRIISPSSLSPGTIIAFSIQARVSPLANTGDTLENKISVSGNSFSRITKSSRTDINTVSGGLEIYKDVSHTSGVLVGQPIDYTITVRNTGSSSVSGVNIQDVFASTLDILTPLPQGSSYNASTRTFSYYQSSLAAGVEIVLTIHARPNNTVTTNRTIYNTASVTWGSPSQSGTSNQVHTDVTPAGAILLDKTLYSSVGSVYPGDTISYTIALTNIGSLNVSSINLSDNLDPYFEYQSIYPGSLSMAGSCSNTYHYCSWSINSPSTLSPDGRISFSIKGKVSTSIPLGSILENTVSGNATDAYSRVVYGSDTFTKSITSPPDAPTMSINLDMDPLQVRIGDSMTVKIGVKNSGDIDATSVKAGIQFPTILDITSASTTRGTVTTNSSNRSVVNDIGTLAAGHTTHITIVVKVNSTAVVNKAHTQFATLVWYKDNEIDSENVRWRVLPGSTLPGTGILPGDSGSKMPSGQLANVGKASVYARLPDFSRPSGFNNIAGSTGISPVFFILIAVCSILGLVGCVVLIYGLWARIRRPLWAGRYTRIGLILMLSSVLFGLASLGLNRNRETPAPTQQQLAELSGTKPIYPTREPTEPPPTPAVTPTQWLPPTTTPTPQSLPEYPIPSPTALPTTGPDGGDPDPSDVTRIKIPAMGLDTVVKFVPFNGDTWLIGGLKQEIAWMGDTSWPGLGSNTGLAGHIDLADGSKGPFWNLKDLKAGDQVYIYTQQKIYVYKVRDQVVVEDSDMSVIEETEDPQITMITCTGWDPGLRTYLKRLIVYADLSEVKTLQGS